MAENLYKLCRQIYCTENGLIDLYLACSLNVYILENYNIINFDQYMS